MAVIYDGKNQIFNLQTQNTSYLIGIYENKLLLHIHYGKKIETTYGIFDMLDKQECCSYDWNPKCRDFQTEFALSEQLLELPAYGDGDYRPPAIHAIYGDGSSVSKLYYKEHKIYNGKPEISDMPSAYVESEEEAQTLELHLEDTYTGLMAILYYTVYPAYDVILRSAKYINQGKEPIILKQVDSGCIDFDRCNFDLVHFYGTWAKERLPERSPLFHGLQEIDSTRGASSHTQNPFLCLADQDATEDNGQVYGMNLLYSGNFHAGAYVDTFGKTRLFCGIHSFDFQWRLESGEKFQTPECMMVYSMHGFTGMSHLCHEFIKKRICRGTYRDLERPILINNWEATYFNFDEEKLVNIAEKASEIGVELMVMDDGWFGKRNDDHSSLGDWFENRDKLPGGLESLARRINDLGMKFGIWVEPEMVSEKSELYLKHPDWCLHVPGRSKSEGRHQLILDLSREEVCDYVLQTLSALFERANVEYVKWDMNRNMTEIGSAYWNAERQREVAHRYMIGLYRILGTLKKKFPHILMEGCSGGGGRFDLGMLCFFDQIWVSDDTDAIERIEIQTGTSYGYPLAVMGAHVSACPNHQTGRTTEIQTRGYVALPGQFGYELDLSTLNRDELEEVGKQIKLYKELAPIFHQGNFYRIKNPFNSVWAVWEFVSKDQQVAVVEIFTMKAVPAASYESFTLKDLDAGAIYRERFSGKRYTGEALMYLGLKHKCTKEYHATLLIFEKEELCNENYDK